MGRKKKWKLEELIPNPNNPRLIPDEKFDKLVNSITSFPRMMELRPIVIDENNVILGGNMRYKALKHLGYDILPDGWVKKAEELTDEEKREFIIKDNVGFGEWDWILLENEWEASDLEKWGLDVSFEDMEMPDIDDLIGSDNDKPPTMKITFDCPEQLQKAEIDIQELIDRKYEGAYFSVSCGEI